MQKLIPALLLLLLTVASCSKSDDDAAKNATWVVTLYQVPSTTPAPVKEDKTDLFTGYTFEFNDDNTMIVYLPDGSTVSDAKWGIPPGTATAKLSADNPVAPLDAIMGDWNVNEKTDTDFKLSGPDIATSDNNSGEVLHFKKQ
jgi:hypothetical protein